MRERLGVDIGDGVRRGGLTNAGREHFSAVLGGPVRNDLHGLDVYEHQEQLTFVAVSANTSIGKSAAAFSSQVTGALQRPQLASEKETLAAELYCSSFFDVSFRSRLITLVTAIEALLTPASRSAEAVATVTRMEQIVRNADLDSGTRTSLLGSLQWLKQESVGQAGRAFVSAILGRARYGDLEASRFFTRLYDLRSQIVHTGRPQDAGVDLLRVCNEAQRFVADLILGPQDASRP